MPQHATARPDGSGAPQSAAPHAKDSEDLSVTAIRVKLYWPSGGLACDFKNPGTPYAYDLVEEFIQRMEEGLFEDLGISRCHTAADGSWLERYSLVWEGRCLGDGERLSELDLPLDAALTLIRSSIPRE